MSGSMNLAATHGKMEILQYLSTHQISSGSLDIVKFLHDKHCTSEKDLLTLAAATGKFVIVKWIHDNCDIRIASRSDMDISARFNLDIVKFLHEYRSEGCSTMAMDYAAVCGHLEIVRFLHEHRSEGCTVRAMNGAAGNGHLEVVKFLHTHRSEGNVSQALSSATSNGRLRVA